MAALQSHNSPTLTFGVSSGLLSESTLGINFLLTGSYQGWDSLYWNGANDKIFKITVF